MDDVAEPVPPICLRLCALMLQYFQTPRPGFRFTNMGLQGYSIDEIRRAFYQLRRLRWLEATISIDVEGNRYSGLVVSLTSLGRAAARVLSAESTINAEPGVACQKNPAGAGRTS